MKYKEEMYKGYKIKFKEKNMNGKNLVVGEYPSKITGRIMADYATTKQAVMDKCKRGIDKEYKMKGMK